MDLLRDFYNKPREFHMITNKNKDTLSPAQSDAAATVFRQLQPFLLNDSRWESDVDRVKVGIYKAAHRCPDNVYFNLPPVTDVVTTVSDKDPGFLKMDKIEEPVRKRNIDTSAFSALVQHFDRNRSTVRLMLIDQVAKDRGYSYKSVKLSDVPPYNFPDSLLAVPKYSSSEIPITTALKQCTIDQIEQYSPSTIVTFWGEGISGLKRYARVSGVSDIHVLFSSDFSNDGFDEVVSGISREVTFYSHVISKNMVDITERDLLQHNIPSKALFVCSFVPEIMTVATYFDDYFCLYRNDVGLSGVKVTFPIKDGRWEDDCANLTYFLNENFSHKMTQDYFFLVSSEPGEVISYCQHKVFRDSYKGDEWMSSVAPGCLVQTLGSVAPRFNNYEFSSHWSICKSVSRTVSSVNFVTMSADVNLDYVVPIDVNNNFMPNVEVIPFDSMGFSDISARAALPWDGRYLVHMFEGRRYFFDYDNYGISYIERRSRLIQAGLDVLPLSTTPDWANSILVPPGIVRNVGKVVVRRDVYLQRVMDGSHILENVEGCVVPVPGLAYNSSVGYVFDAKYTGYLVHDSVPSDSLFRLESVLSTHLKKFEYEANVFVSPPGGTHVSVSYSQSINEFDVESLSYDGYSSALSQLKFDVVDFLQLDIIEEGDDDNWWMDF